MSWLCASRAQAVLGVVPFDYKEPDAAEKAVAKFTEGAVFRLSKVILSREDGRWIGSPKKLMVIMNKSEMVPSTDPQEVDQVALALILFRAVPMSTFASAIFQNKGPLENESVTHCNNILAVARSCPLLRCAMLLSTLCFQMTPLERCACECLGDVRLPDHFNSRAYEKWL